MVIHPGSLPRLARASQTQPLADAELADLERRYPEGVTSAEIIGFFQDRGVKLSEGTFRKYVQLGLLSRSKRVGKKGKHKGSKGIYPVSVIRQIVAIKQMMAEGLTIEQIRQSWLRFRPRIESIETDLGELLDEMRRELGAPHFDSGRRQRLEEQLAAARTDAADLIQRLHALEQDVAWSPERAEAESAELLESGEGTGRFY